MIRRYSRAEIRRMSNDKLDGVRRATVRQLNCVKHELVKRGLMVPTIKEVRQIGEKSWIRVPGLFARGKKD